MVEMSFSRTISLLFKERVTDNDIYPEESDNILQ